MSKALRIVISGGGTGGHIFPAIAIANELKRQYPDIQILFVGALGRMEMERVPAAGYDIIGLPVVGLKRSLSLKNLALPFKLWKSLRRAGRILNDFQPDMAVGVGGYASGPLLRMAARKKIPYLIQEQNAYPGLTNKLLAKKASAICVANEQMERFFPKEKIRLTGNPVRSHIVAANPDLKQEALVHFGLNPAHKCLLVVGGSLGARSLNQCIMDFAKAHPQMKGIDIVWQSGGYYQTICQEFVQQHPRDYLHLQPFISRMDLAFAAADLVISRAGAGTLAELCIARRACIFVPSPNVSEDHQTHNALALVRQQAALLVPEAEASASLMPKALELLQDTAALRRLEENIAPLARPDAATAIVEQITQIVNEKKA